MIVRKVLKNSRPEKRPPRREVTVTEFKLRCAALLDEVERTKETIVVTRRGKPVARLAPSFLGFLKGRVEITGDIISPIDVEWTGDEENLRKTTHFRRDDQ